MSLRHLCPDFYGATYEKMGELGYVMWPCRDESDADQGRRICLKRSSIPRTGWRSSSPATGSRRSISSPTSTQCAVDGARSRPLLVSFNDR